MISSESQPTNWKNKIVSHIAQQQIDRCIFCGSNFNNIFHAQNSFHNTIVNVISLNHGSGAFPYNNTSASSSRGCERILSAECEKMSKPHTKYNRWFATCFNWNRRFLSSPLLVVILRHNRLSKSGICRAYANKAFRNIGHFSLAHPRSHSHHQINFFSLETPTYYLFVAFFRPFRSATTSINDFFVIVS